MVSVLAHENQSRHLVSSSSLVSHGPDTPEQLEGSDALIADVKSLAPDLLRLFTTLGERETRRNAGEWNSG